MSFIPEKQGFLLMALAFTFFTACEEEAILTSFSDQPMHLETAIFNIDQIITYQSPPVIGSQDYLFFGNYEEFENPFSLIQIKDTDNRNIFKFESFNDTSFTVDSMIFYLHYAGDSAVDLNSYQLRFFPDGGDSVFSETETNYLNFDAAIASSVISTATLETDSSDTTYSKKLLKFVLSSEIMDIFMDTSLIVHNRSFLIEPVEELLDLYRFNSRDNQEGRTPELKVHFTYEDSSGKDTLISSFESSSDISIIIPTSLTAEDSSLAISRGKGLNVLAFADLAGFDPPLTAIVNSAKLILSPISADSINDYTIIAYPLENFTDIDKFSTYDYDPLKLDLNYFTSTDLKENIYEIQEKSFFQGLALNKITNFGFKIYSSSSNNPFETVYFHGLESDSLYPLIKVEYVVP